MTDDEKLTEALSQLKANNKNITRAMQLQAEIHARIDVLKKHPRMKDMDYESLFNTCLFWKIAELEDKINPKPT